MARCTICHTKIDQGDPVTQCEQCKQDYHSSCWTELGGCGTYGCVKAAAAEKPPPPAVVGMGWGDTKACPSCRSDISSSLLVCRCGAKFPWADPMTPLEYDEWKTAQEEIKGAKSLLTFLFIGTLIGFTAPICGPIAGIYAYVKRDKLAGDNGTYLGLGYGAASLGGVYGLIILLLGLGM